MLNSLICDRVDFYTRGKFVYFIYTFIHMIFTNISLNNYISIKNKNIYLII